MDLGFNSSYRLSSLVYLLQNPLVAYYQPALLAVQQRWHRLLDFMLPIVLLALLLELRPTVDSATMRRKAPRDAAIILIR